MARDFFELSPKHIVSLAWNITWHDLAINENRSKSALYFVDVPEMEFLDINLKRLESFSPSYS